MAQDYKHRAGLPRKGGTANTPPPTNPGQRKSPLNSSKPNKPRVNTRKATSTVNTEKVSVGRWVLVVVIVAVFAYFLYRIPSTTELESESARSKPITITQAIRPDVKKREVKPVPLKVIAPVVEMEVKQEVKAMEVKPVPLKVIAPVAEKAKPKAIPKPEVQFDFYKILPEAEFVVPDYEVKTRKREELIGKVKEGASYSVQAGSFRNFKDADSLKAKLILMGFSPKIEKAPVKSVIWYRVKMGPYPRIGSVDAIKSRLTANGMDALVIELRE